MYFNAGESTNGTSGAGRHAQGGRGAGFLGGPVSRRRTGGGTALHLRDAAAAGALHLRRDPRAPAALVAASRFADAAPEHRAPVPHPGRRAGRRPQYLPLLHGGREAGQPAVAAEVDALHGRDGRAHPGRLPASVGHRVPERPLDRGGRRPVPERRGGQADHLQPGGARAGQDRDLRGLGGAEDRGHPGEPGAAGHHAADGFLHRPGDDTPRQGGDSAGAPGAGAHVRGGRPHHRGAAGGAEAGPPDVPHDRGAQGPGARDRLHRQRGDERSAAARPDEEDQAALVALVDDRAGHLQARGVRRGRGGHRGLLPRPGLHHRAGRPAGARLPRTLGRRRDPRAAAADSGRRGRAVPHRRGQLRRQRDPPRGGPAPDLRGHRAGGLLQRRRRAEGLRRRP